MMPTDLFDSASQEQGRDLFANRFSSPSAPVKIGKDAFPDTLREELKNAGWGIRNIAGAGSAVVNAIEGLKGLVGKTDKNEVDAQNIIADSAPVGNLAGNVAMLAPTMFVPGANTVTGAATIGAAQGALLTPGDIVDRLRAAAFGAGGGAVGAGVGKAVGAAKPIAANANAGILANEGVSLTPGQNLGGWAKNLEDRATSLPGVGNVIDAARKRGVEDFNRAAIRRVTDPMEQAGMPINVSGIGRPAAADMRQELGNAYDTVLARSSANAMEPQFVQNMASLRQLVSGLPQKEQAAFDAIIEREIGQRMAPNGMVNAENLQAVKSGIGTQIDNFAASTDGYQRQLGQALKQADEEFRQLVARANPQNAQDLKAIDTAYANFKRIQRAAGGIGAEEGIFTPTQLNSAIRAMDKSKDKRAFSEGTALMQDLADAGKAVLPSKVGDSGTASRQNLLSVGGLAGLLASAPAYLAYSRPGAAAINTVANKGLLPLAEGTRRTLADNRLITLLGMAAPREFVGN